jgi:hypothetical protein
MPKVRVQCALHEKVWARLDALKLAPPGGAAGRGGSQQTRRERDLETVVMAGLEALEAREAARDTDRSTPPTAPTPRNDVPIWLRETPSETSGDKP